MKKLWLPDGVVKHQKKRSVSGIIDQLWALPGDKELTAIELLHLVFKDDDENREVAHE